MLLAENSSSNWMDSLRSQHLEQQEYDEERTKYLEERGYRVLRFWNNEVLNNTDAVLQAIWNALNEDKKK